MALIHPAKNHGRIKIKGGFGLCASGLQMQQCGGVLMPWCPQTNPECSHGLAELDAILAFLPGLLGLSPSCPALGWIPPDLSSAELVQRAMAQGGV